ncbi:uncharacterized protein LOC133531055 isoform X2 [Cydia pomonella]|uniref:uncharacterized protein LOC133531055 isoform X2 n=1 Tax=Cydia pomonella TaxID=82600 RepID=UPI002ADD6CB5|nr:uncharacterized protein LOC133531055 isoform X2 [Cydia pomonella]
MIKMEGLLVMLLMVISINAAAVRQKLTQEDCDNMDIRRINNYYYVKAAPINLTGIPSDFSVHWRSGRVFYTLISDDYLKMKIQVLKGNQVHTIKMDVVGQSTTVDNFNDIVYVATDNGVYKYNDEGTLEHYTAAGEDVMYVAVSKDGTTMYIATWPQNRVQVISNNGQKQETFSLIPNGHDLRIDTCNNMYFVAAKTSYVLQADNSIPIRIKGLPTNNMTGIFVNRSDKVYAMDETGNMYKIDPNYAKATLLGSFHINGVNAFALDALDNVLIGVNGAILKYNKMESSPCSVLMTLS